MQYVLQLASFPTNMPTIKRAVKKSNHCSVVTRDETTWSMYAVANNAIVQQANMDAGKKKRNKEKGKLIVRRVLEQHKKHTQRQNKDKNYMTKQNKLKDKLTCKTNQFKVVRTSKEINAFLQNINNGLPENIATTALPTVTPTSLIAKRVPFSAMTKKDGWENAIQDKLAAQNVNIDAFCNKN